MAFQRLWLWTLLQRRRARMRNCTSFRIGFLPHISHADRKTCPPGITRQAGTPLPLFNEGLELQAVEALALAADPIGIAFRNSCRSKCL
jgi:hypothetical protein